VDRGFICQSPSAAGGNPPCAMSAT
jgi:hypothetical protein